jgi:hypothetical protein
MGLQGHACLPESKSRAADALTSAAAAAAAAAAPAPAAAAVAVAAADKERAAVVDTFVALRFGRRMRLAAGSACNCCRGTMGASSSDAAVATPSRQEGGDSDVEDMSVMGEQRVRRGEVMGEQRVRRGEDDEDEMTWMLELRLAWTAPSLLLLMMRTVSQLRS